MLRECVVTVIIELDAQKSLGNAPMQNYMLVVYAKIVILIDIIM